MPEPPPVTFQCVKCSAQNEVPLDRNRKELLFGGGDANAGGGARPISRGPQRRTSIIRCRECQHANRITIDVGDP